jgi:hypothetical protein
MELHKEFDGMGTEQIEHALLLLWQMATSVGRGRNSSEHFGMLTLQAVVRNRAKRDKRQYTETNMHGSAPTSRNVEDFFTEELTLLSDVFVALAKTSALRGNKAHPGRLMNLWGCVQDYLRYSTSNPRIHQ